ncbi:MAG: DUF3617 domain-containing protein [Chakrabartia sp.]
MIRRSMALGLILALAACEKTPNPVQSGKSAAASAASHSAQVSTLLAPGLWQIDQSIDPTDFERAQEALADGRQQMAEKLIGPRQTSSMCLSVDQARSPSAAVIAGRDAGQCSFESFSRNRETLDAVITCVHANKPGRTLLAVHGTYQGTRFLLDAVMRLEPNTPFDTMKGPMPTADAEPIRMHTRIEGSFKGECPAGEDVAQ